MISSMEKVKKSGLMALGIKANINQVKNMERANIICMMDPTIKVIGRITKSLVKVYTSGLMVDPTQVNGSITICMDLANITGRMEDFMRVSI